MRFVEFETADGKRYAVDPDFVRSVKEGNTTDRVFLRSELGQIEVCATFDQAVSLLEMDLADYCEDEDPGDVYDPPTGLDLGPDSCGEGSFTFGTGAFEVTIRVDGPK